ncbi:MAG: hypothetical protein IPI67_11455 [Myxococcales bacterium]|nr:hypothetical protein [Myxococcales bacterium]
MRFTSSATLTFLVSLGSFLPLGCGTDDSCEGTSSCGNSSGGGTAGAGGGTGGSSASGGTGGGGGTGNTGGTAGSAGSGATGGTGGVAGSDGGQCDASKAPGEETCVIDEQYGVFVSPKGDDSAGDGTKTKPYKSLSKAVSNAASAKKRVYACDDGGGYTESAALDLSALNGSGLYGGFDCTAWSYSTTSKAKLAGASTAVRVDAVATSLTIEDFDVAAADASTAGASSLGVFVTSSTNLTLRRVKITAGKGMAGTPGTNGANGDAGGAPGAAQQGTGATCSSAPATQVGGAWAAASACGSLGGKGGNAEKAAAGGNGTPGTPLTNVTPANVDNKGGGSGSHRASGSRPTGFQRQLLLPRNGSRRFRHIHRDRLLTCQRQRRRR